MSTFDYIQIGGQLNDTVAAVLNYIGIETAHQCKVGTITVPTTTGSKVVTGVGFQPECLILFGIASSGNQNLENSFFHLGVATSSSDQWALAIFGPDNIGAPFVRWCRWQENRIYTIVSTAGAAAAEASLTSFDSDGFTYNLIDAPGVAGTVGYIALRGGGSYACGVESVPAAGGTQAITVGFVPDVMLFGSVTKETGELDGSFIDEDCLVSIGAADDTRQHSIAAGSRETSTNTGAWQSPTSCLTLAETVTGAGNLLCQAELVTMDAGGGDVEIDWTTFDGQEYRFGWLALQNAAVDRFTYVPSGDPGQPATHTITTPLNSAPNGFIGFDLTLTAADDDAGVVAGAHMGFSGCGSNFTDEVSASWGDVDAPFLTVQQTYRHFQTGTFGAARRRTAPGVTVGSDNMVHRCNLSNPVFVEPFIPQIYRYDRYGR